MEPREPIPMPKIGLQLPTHPITPLRFPALPTNITLDRNPQSQQIHSALRFRFLHRQLCNVTPSLSLAHPHTVLYLHLNNNYLLGMYTHRTIRFSPTITHLSLSHRLPTTTLGRWATLQWRMFNRLHMYPIPPTKSHTSSLLGRLWRRA